MHKLSTPPPPPSPRYRSFGRTCHISDGSDGRGTSFCELQKPLSATSMSTTKLHPSFLPFNAEGRSNIRGTDAQVAGVSDRDYLNGLVEASVAKTVNQVIRIIKRTKLPFEVYEGNYSLPGRDET